MAGPSLVLDKSATPSEQSTRVEDFLAAARPAELVAQRTVGGTAGSFDEMKFTFSKYQDLNIQTGSAMIDQFKPQYIGMANMYALPVAVGGVDFPGQDSWRRSLEDGPAQVHLQQTPHENEEQTPAAAVDLFSFMQGTSRNILGQFRRDWPYLPGVFNLWFRSQVNLGGSLGISSKMQADKGCDAVEEDAAMAASKLYQLLDSGYYHDSRGRRRKINNDTSKLMWAVGITQYQKALLSDMKFRTRLLCGTQEVRTQICRIGFWASVVYGNGICITVSPGERHNYLAIRLSRYRAADPHVTAPKYKDEQAWIGSE